MMRSSPQSYKFPLLLALCLHLAVLAVLLLELSLPVHTANAPAASGNIVQAVAVSQQVLDNYEQARAAAQQAKLAAARQAQLKAQQLQQQRLQEQQLKQQQLQLQKLRAAQQAEKAQAAKAAAEKAAQQRALREAAEKIAKQRAEQQATAKAAAKVRQQAQQKKLQQALAQDMQKELASDQTELNRNAATLRQEQGITDKYKALIIQAISQQWIVPPNLPSSLSCELKVRVAPGGVVLQVTIVKSSGNALLDNSAIAAVHKASPLPVPTAPGMFDQFRELNLTVRPDGTVTSG